MTISTKPLDQLTEADFAALVDNRVAERRDLEFKRDQIGTNDRAKSELLKDVAGLANAAGGDLVLGIEEQDGAAAALCPFPLVEPNAEVLRLEQVIT